MGLIDFLFGKTGKSTVAEHIQWTRSADALCVENIIGKHFTLDQVRIIPMGQTHLHPIDFTMVMDEGFKKQIYILSLFGKIDNGFLPNSVFSSSDDVSSFFFECDHKMSMGHEISYAIKMGKDKYLGLIFIHTPSFNKNEIDFPYWTIDFCLFDSIGSEYVMTQSLEFVLNFMKSELNVDEVYAYVDQHNSEYINLLKSLHFKYQPKTITDKYTRHKAILFRCPVHEITFNLENI